MASLYPSLEDMKVDQVQRAQVQAAESYANNNNYPYPGRPNETTPSYGVPPPVYGAPAGVQVQAPFPSYGVPAGVQAQAPTPGYGAPAGVQMQAPSAPPPDASMYPFQAIMEEYMGLKLQPPSGPLAIPQPRSVVPVNGYGNGVGYGAVVPAGQGGTMIAPLSGQSLGLARANVTHGVREIILCKDAKGKTGMRLRDVNKGVFVQFVAGGSPAALAGVRFGDQILQINGKDVTGYSGDKTMKKLKKADGQRIVLAVRDRPFERTITLHKDSSGHVGFQYKDNEITAIAKETSAARNGLLIKHHILEINGQNVIGLKNKDLDKMFKEAGQVVTLTIMPNYLYEHMVKTMADGLVKKMDHSIPDVC